MPPMRVLRLVSLLVGCIGCSGCSVGKQLCQTMASEAKYEKSERRIERHERRLARDAWQALEQSGAVAGQTPDFARGFEDGFAGYLHTGHLEPPAVPPEEYWWFRRNAQRQYEAGQDWTAGYRVGAIEAAGSGCREWLVVPASILCAGTPEVPYAVPDTPTRAEPATASLSIEMGL